MHSSNLEVNSHTQIGKEFWVNRSETYSIKKSINWLPYNIYKLITFYLNSEIFVTHPWHLYLEIKWKSWHYCLNMIFWIWQNITFPKGCFVVYTAQINSNNIVYSLSRRPLCSFPFDPWVIYEAVNRLHDFGLALFWYTNIQNSWIILYPHYNHLSC